MHEDEVGALRCGQGVECLQAEADAGLACGAAGNRVPGFGKRAECGNQKGGVADRQEQVDMRQQRLGRVADDGPGAERVELLGERGAETSAGAGCEEEGCDAHGGAMKRGPDGVKRRRGR